MRRTRSHPIALSALAGIALLIARPSSGRESPPAPAIPQAQLDAAGEVARREAPAIAGAPGTPVVGFKMMLPFIYYVEMPGGRILQLMVLDGKVVRDRSLDVVARYLRITHLLTTANAGDSAAATRLVALLNQWGEPPPGFESIELTDPKLPGSPPPGIQWKNGAEVFTIYARWRKTPGPPVDGKPVKFDLGRPKWLRATLRIDGRSRLNWIVEMIDAEKPGRWTPFKQAAPAP